jgi:hypothetical protein
LAFLCQTVLGWVDHTSQLVRQTLSARRTFVQDLQAVTRDLLCDRWDRWLDFMIQGLELVMPPNSSEVFKMRIAGFVLSSLTMSHSLRSVLCHGPLN